MSYQALSTSYQSFISQVASIPIPRSVSEALQNPQWVAAMQEEMNALERNGTWELLPLPHRVKWQ